MKATTVNEQILTEMTLLRDADEKLGRINEQHAHLHGEYNALMLQQTQINAGIRQREDEAAEYERTAQVHASATLLGSLDGSEDELQADAQAAALRRSVQRSQQALNQIVGAINAKSEQISQLHPQIEAARLYRTRCQFLSVLPGLFDAITAAENALVIAVNAAREHNRQIEVYQNDLSRSQGHNAHSRLPVIDLIVRPGADASTLTERLRRKQGYIITYADDLAGPENMTPALAILADL